MQLSHLRIHEIVNVDGLPAYARGTAYFSNGRAYEFHANFAHGYGDDSVITCAPRTGASASASRTAPQGRSKNASASPTSPSASATPSPPSSANASPLPACQNLISADTS